MLNVSDEFERLVSQNANVLLKATLRYVIPNGYGQMSLTGDSFMSGAATFTEATSSSSSFDVGAAVIGSCKLVLNNMDGRFDECDFTGATVTPYIGKELSDGTVEWVRKGLYHVDQPDSYGASISLDSLDNMSLLERPYADVATEYPASLGTIMRDICSKCGLTLWSTEFPNAGYVVARRPDDSSLTCLAMTSYVAQVAGCWAKIASDDRLRIGWYDLSAFEAEDWLDGDEFDGATPYASGDTADGGSLADYSSGDSVEGGSFDARPYKRIHAFSSITLSTDDVVVTGVRVTAQDDLSEDEGGTGAEGETALFGSEGYVLDLGDNPLVLYGQAGAVAKQVGERVAGMRFRPFDLSAVGDPALEAGDPVVITDAAQNEYRSFATNVTYKAGAYQAVSCPAETPSRRSATGFSAVTKAIVDARNELRRERTDRQLAIEELGRRLEESSGIHITPVRQQDGSTVYYMHDKPRLDDSAIVWKMTAEAIGISTDGGKTYPYGLDVSGTAVLDRIYTIGLDASYINTGAITVRDPATRKVLLSADIDTGAVTVDGSAVKVGASQTVTDAIGAINSEIAQVKLTSSGISATVSSMQAVYGTCGTAAATQQKAVACDGFARRNGSIVSVKFTYANTASSPMLNVNGTGAAYIYLNNSTLQKEHWWAAGDVVTFVFSGTYWYVVDSAVYKQLSTTNSAVSSLQLKADSFEVSIASLKAGYAVCSTAAATQVKAVTLSNFSKYVGATVTVRFSNANTASSPRLQVTGRDTALGYIVVNNSYMSQSQWWSSGATLTFVWDGTYWRLGDGGTLAKIQVLKDSLELSVSNFALGSKASIKLVSDGTTLSTASANLSNVRSAFANDKSAIAISAGTITFNSNTFVVNSSYFKVTSTGVITATSGKIGGFTINSYQIYNDKLTLYSSGMRLKMSGSDVGLIGTSTLSGDSSKKGLNFDLEYTGHYMTWAAKMSASADVYTMKWSYARVHLGGSTKWSANCLHAGCDIDMHWYKIRNLGGGVTQTINYVQVLGVNSDGTLNKWGSNGMMKFENGLLTGLTYYKK